MDQYPSLPPSAFLDQSLDLQGRYSGLLFISEKLTKENNSLKQEIADLKQELSSYKKPRSTIELKNYLNIPMKILFVEDNETTRTIGKKMVSSLGHSISTASNSFEAIGQVVCNEYDAVIIDYNLGTDSPNGTELATILNDKGHKGITMIVSCETSIKDPVLDKPNTKDAWSQLIMNLK